jgi:hypothetical protein
MKMKVFLYSLMLFISGIICQTNLLEWSDPVSGTKYDFSTLKRSQE